jgi:hypothetical protein
MCHQVVLSKREARQRWDEKALKRGMKETMNSLPKRWICHAPSLPATCPGGMVQLKSEH